MCALPIILQTTDFIRPERIPRGFQGYPPPNDSPEHGDHARWRRIIVHPSQKLAGSSGVSTFCPIGVHFSKTLWLPAVWRKAQMNRGHLSSIEFHKFFTLAVSLLHAKDISVHFSAPLALMCLYCLRHQIVGFGAREGFFFLYLHTFVVWLWHPVCLALSFLHTPFRSFSLLFVHSKDVFFPVPTAGSRYEPAFGNASSQGP